MMSNPANQAAMACWHRFGLPHTGGYGSLLLLIALILLAVLVTGAVRGSHDS